MNINIVYNLTFLFFIMIVTSIVIHTSNAYAVDFFDSTGYIPDWAVSMNQYQALERCSSIVGDTTKDGEWCLQWTANVVGSGESASTISNETQSVKTDHICIENYICAYPGDFLEYAGVYSDNPAHVDLTIMKFVEPSNKTDININLEGNGIIPNPTILVLKKQTGITFSPAINSIVPFDDIVQLPVEKSIKSNPAFMSDNGTKYYYKTEQVIDKPRTVFVVHIGNDNGYFFEEHYDNETGILVLEMDQNSIDGNLVKHEEKLINTNILDYNTILQPEQPITPPVISRNNESTTNPQSSQPLNNENSTINPSQVQSLNINNNTTMNIGYLTIGIIFVIVLPAIAIIIAVWKIKKFLAKRKSTRLQKGI